MWTAGFPSSLQAEPCGHRSGAEAARTPLPSPEAVKRVAGTQNEATGLPVRSVFEEITYLTRDRMMLRGSVNEHFK